MEKVFNGEWANQTWKILLYLEGAFDNLEGQDAITVKPLEWYANLEGDEGVPEASIGFRVSPASAKGVKTQYLWIGLWMGDDTARKDRPIWIQVLRGEQEVLWERLKTEFNDPDVVVDEEQWAVGLPWPLFESASNEEILAAGENLGGRISKALMAD